MEEPTQEHIQLDDLAAPDAYDRIGRDIERSKSRTRNWLAGVLVVTLAAAPLLHVGTLWLVLEGDGGSTTGTVTANDVQAVFDAWYPIMAPLAGAGIGFYFGSQRNEAQSRHRRASRSTTERV